jgi:hypothetical protein
MISTRHITILFRRSTVTFLFIFLGATPPISTSHQPQTYLDRQSDRVHNAEGALPPVFMAYRYCSLPTTTKVPKKENFWGHTKNLSCVRQPGLQETQSSRQHQSATHAQFHKLHTIKY